MTVNVNQSTNWDIQEITFHFVESTASAKKISLATGASTRKNCLNPAIGQIF